jgi:D-alanyl-lipoteichoic acid acyltransferase DltB (MBOAT superfamily)
MAMLYAFVTGLADLVTGLAMQTGYRISEVFDAPFLSRSPRDFWSRRWNLFVHRFAVRNVYVPLGGRERPGLAIAIVFLLSGLMHEYLVVACGRGLGSYTGYSLAFFVLQGTGVAVHARWGRGRMPRGLAIALHFLWMLATSPLFFLPLDEAAGFSTW